MEKLSLEELVNFKNKYGPLILSDGFLNPNHHELEIYDDWREWNKTPRIEANKFANPRLANNGGGYHQPLISFIYGKEKGEIEDTNCGDFGKRYRVRIGGKLFYYDEVSRNLTTYSDSNKAIKKDNSFIKEFNKLYPEYEILDIKEVVDF